MVDIESRLICRQIRGPYPIRSGISAEFNNFNINDEASVQLRDKPIKSRVCQGALNEDQIQNQLEPTAGFEPATY